MYSPKINEVTVRILYQISKKVQKPMTQVVNILLSEVIKGGTEKIFSICKDKSKDKKPWDNNKLIIKD